MNAAGLIVIARPTSFSLQTADHTADFKVQIFTDDTRR